MFARAVQGANRGGGAPLPAGGEHSLLEDASWHSPERDRWIHTCCAYDPAEPGALLDACRRVDAERLGERVASEPR
jgi:hypothetical protein